MLHRMWFHVVAVLFFLFQVEVGLDMVDGEHVALEQELTISLEAVDGELVADLKPFVVDRFKCSQPARVQRIFVDEFCKGLCLRCWMLDTQQAELGLLQTWPLRFLANNDQVARHHGFWDDHET
jgi:hypothetical protein